MSLYPITSGMLPQASDVQQLNNIFNGTHDIGQVNLAPAVATPTTTGFSVATQSGGSLGVGTYQYVFTYVTGQYKTDNTIQITGETPASSSLSVTTTSSNKSVAVTLPNPGPVSIIATRIYRTAVGGSTYGLIATVKDGVTSYTDTTVDGSRGAAPPTTNSTGTTIGVQNPYCFVNVSSYIVQVSSANTITQLTINNTYVPRSFGVTLTNNSMQVQQSGIYAVDALVDISGLNVTIEADITIRVLHADTTYNDSTHYIEGWSGLGGNATLGSVPVTHSMMLTLVAGDQVQVFVRCGEAPRNINSYFIRLWKISN